MIFIGKKAPIVLFVYKRPEHTRRTLESLAANEGASESELFIFCDGPKSEKDIKAVKEVHALAKSHNWCKNVHVIERDENLGLANSIISGVTEIVNRYDRIIVLEDDLLLSPQFLNYMNDALKIYKDVAKVMHISGYMFSLQDKLPETFFYRGSYCWGWATWKSAWEKFEPNAQVLLTKLRDKNLRWEFNIEGSEKFYKMLKSQTEGKINSWAIRWYASVFLNKGLCLHSGKSLVNNIGHDASGIHCGATDIYNVEIRRKRVLNFTEDIHENKEAVKLIANFYRSVKRSFPDRVLSKLKQIMTSS